MLCQFIIGGAELNNGFPPAYADFLSSAGIDLKTIFEETFRVCNSVPLEALQNAILQGNVMGLIDQTFPRYVIEKCVTFDEPMTGKAVSLFCEVVQTMVFYFHLYLIQIYQYINSLIVLSCPPEMMAQTMGSAVIRVFSVTEFGKDFLIHVSAT